MPRANERLKKEYWTLSCMVSYVIEGAKLLSRELNGKLSVIKF
jgi:hypothetical protein